MKFNQSQIHRFQRVVWDYFEAHRRELPWRQPDVGPYAILVSEVMLQQTQVPRVISKYKAFLAVYPTTAHLAAAPLGDVLALWSGLGYNRRAKFLWQAAQMIEQDFAGAFPQTASDLQKLPGVGANTAGAIMAYAYNQPAVFLETNVRTVFIHHFFADVTGVDDKELRPLVEQALPAGRAREWYWALMDYGTHLKATAGNAAVRSRHHTKQSPLEGSRRQIRGRILKYLKDGPHSRAQLAELIHDQRLNSVLADLQTEGLTHSRANRFHLGS